MLPLVDAATCGRLLAKGRERGRDYPTVVKIFNPADPQRWLCSELNPDDGDTLFGLCDLDMGSPELGNVSLTERLELAKLLPLGLERDASFVCRGPLSVYARAAEAVGRIVAMSRGSHKHSRC